MLETVNKPEYASMPPCEIVPSLADKGVYIASESTFYRILREEKMQNHRGRAAEPQHRPISTHVAMAPNQVWMWDYPDVYVIPTFQNAPGISKDSIQKHRDNSELTLTHTAFLVNLRQGQRDRRFPDSSTDDFVPWPSRLLPFSSRYLHMHKLT